jgi:type IV pilus assembly protein PilA
MAARLQTGTGMTDWYYHAPGQGRVGPLSADEMRARYRDRRITRDMLAWHDGLREWQPVERLIEELGLSGIEQDLSRPPPVPPRPAAATASHAARPSTHIEPPPSNRSGCIIAAVAVGIGGLVLLAILAAIALPAYQDYVKRAKGVPPQAPEARTFDADAMADADALARELVTQAMRQFYVANGNVCPDLHEFERIQVRQPRLQGNDDGWFSLDPAYPDSGQCAYDVRYHGFGPALDDRHVRYEVTRVDDTIVIRCSNRTLQPQHLPPNCRP